MVWNRMQEPREALGIRSCQPCRGLGEPTDRGRVAILKRSNGATLNKVVHLNRIPGTVPEKVREPRMQR